LDVKVILRPTVSRPVYPSVRPLSGPVTNFYFSLKFFEQLEVCYFMTPSLTRGQVYNLLLLLGMASAVFLGLSLAVLKSIIVLS
jgi:hypothetical protein